MLSRYKIKSHTSKRKEKRKKEDQQNETIYNKKSCKKTRESHVTHVHVRDDE